MDVSRPLQDIREFKKVNIREGAEGGSRIFCHLSWLAKLYNRTWPHSDICDQKL